MNQSKFERQLTALHKEHFGKCTCCRKPYVESCHTFSGLDHSKRVQEVSYCCLKQIAEIRVGGVFVMMDLNTPEGTVMKNKLASTHPLAAYFI